MGTAFFNRSRRGHTRLRAAASALALSALGACTTDLDTAFRAGEAGPGISVADAGSGFGDPLDDDGTSADFDAASVHRDGGSANRDAPSDQALDADNAANSTTEATHATDAGGNPSEDPRGETTDAGGPKPDDASISDAPTTSSAPDSAVAELAVLVSSVPAAGAVDVDVSGGVILLFDRPVQAGPGVVTLQRGLDAVAADAVWTDSDSVRFDGPSVEITWNSTLSHSTQYSLSVDADAIIGVDGEQFPGFSDPTRLSFTTLAAPPIDLVVTSPITGDTDVPIDTDLRLTFSDDIVAGAIGNISLVDAETKQVVQTERVSGSPRVDVSGTVLSLLLESDLSFATRYFVALDPNAVRSTEGAAFAGFDDESVLWFTTEPPPPLTLVETSPADDTTGVDPDANLVLTFSEPVVAGSGSISVRESLSDALFETVDIASAAATLSDVSVTVNLVGTLDNATQYYVSVTSEAVQSVRGAAYAGLSNPTVFDFTTAEAPPPPLSLLASTPADDAVGVPANTNITLVFSEGVVAGSGNITIFRASDGMVVETIPVGSARVGISGDTVTLDPLGVLSDNTLYYVSIGAGTLISVQGASFPGLLDPTALCFTTDNPFVLLSLSPADDATNVERDVDLVLTFSADVQLGTGNLVIATSTVFETVPMSDPRLTINLNRVTVDLQGTLDYGTRYYVTLAAGAISRLGGGAFAGIAGNSAWNFTTLDACDPGESLGVNGKCWYPYAPAGAQLDWYDARSACISRGSGWDLASIRSAAEQGFVKSLLDASFPNAQLWVAGSDEASEGNWFWVNDSVNFWNGDQASQNGEPAPGEYANWKSDQPSGSGSDQDCARVIPEGGNWLWADDACSQRYGFLCKGPTN